MSNVIVNSAYAITSNHSEFYSTEEKELHRSALRDERYGASRYKYAIVL